MRDYELFHQSLVSKLQISKSSSMWKSTLKSAFEPKMMYLLNDKSRPNGFFFTKSGTSQELFAWLSDVLFKYIVNKK